MNDAKTFTCFADPLGQTTIDSRLRYDTYSPHHHLQRGGEKQNGSPSGRSPNGDTYKHLDSHRYVLFCSEDSRSFHGFTCVFRGTLPSYASQMAGMSSRIGTGIGSSSGPPVAASGLNSSTNHVVPNLQSMRRSSPNSSSQYSQWRIQKDLGGRCSWKFVAIFFVLLSVILVSALIYTTGKFHIFKSGQQLFS